MWLRPRHVFRLLSCSQSSRQRAPAARSGAIGIVLSQTHRRTETPGLAPAHVPFQKSSTVADHRQVDERAGPSHRCVKRSLVIPNGPCVETDAMSVAIGHPDYIVREVVKWVSSHPGPLAFIQGCVGFPPPRQRIIRILDPPLGVQFWNAGDAAAVEVGCSGDGIEMMPRAGLTMSRNSRLAGYDSASHKHW